MAITVPPIARGRVGPTSAEGSTVWSATAMDYLLANSTNDLDVLGYNKLLLAITVTAHATQAGDVEYLRQWSDDDTTYWTETRDDVLSGVFSTQVSGIYAVAGDTAATTYRRAVLIDTLGRYFRMPARSTQRAKWPTLTVEAWGVRA